MKSFRKLFAFAAAAAMLSSLSGCSKPDETQDITIAVICKSTDPYWDSVKIAVNDAASEMSVTADYQAPDKEDVSAQASLLDKAVAAGADAVVIAPVTEDGLNDNLSKCISSGIPVIIIDSSVSFDGVTSFLATDNDAAGAIAGRFAYDLTDSQSCVAVLTHDISSPTAVERRDGFMTAFSTPDASQELSDDVSDESIPSEEGLQETDAELVYEDVKILEPIDCHGNVSEAKEAVKKLIAENPDLDVIYTTNQPVTKGACEGVSELQDSGEIEAGQVQIVGFDYFDGADIYLNNGVMAGVVVQNPYNMGYLGMRQAYAVINGEQVESVMDTGAKLVTKDNLMNDDIQFLLHPSET